MPRRVNPTPTPPTDLADRLLGIPEVAGACGVSPRSVRRYFESGRMPRPVKVSGLIRWRKSDIEAWLADGCRPPAESRTPRR
jgi:predicted DNA-binding transcriptional regulator AlpA